MRNVPVIVVYTHVDTSFFHFCIKECDVYKWAKLVSARPAPQTWVSFYGGEFEKWFLLWGYWGFPYSSVSSPSMFRSTSSSSSFFLFSPVWNPEAKVMWEGLMCQFVHHLFSPVPKPSYRIYELQFLSISSSKLIKNKFICGHSGNHYFIWKHKKKKQWNIGIWHLMAV